VGLHVRVAGHLVHRDRRADRQPHPFIVQNIAHTGQMLNVHHNLGADETIAHAHEEIGAAHQQPRRLPVFLQEPDHLTRGTCRHVIETW